MGKFSQVPVAAVLVLLQVPSFAGEFRAGPNLIEVEKLSALPAGVTQLLSALPDGGVADRGAPFNATDVVREPLPFRRLILAGVSENQVLIAIEHGGIGYSIEALAFELNGDRWVQVERRSFIRHDKPNSLSQLLKWLEGDGGK
jgi:hypothetical protein